jgi:hypothetical protein
LLNRGEKNEVLIEYLNCLIVKRVIGYLHRIMTRYIRSR